MTIKQVKSTLWNLLIIMIGAPIAALVLHGPTESLTHTGEFLMHSLNNAVLIAGAWLLMRSPFGAAYTALVQQNTQTGASPGVAATATQKRIEITSDTPISIPPVVTADPPKAP